MANPDPAISSVHNDINRIVHDPVRLSILKILSVTKEVDFNFLITTLGLSKGNLASHIARLEEGGLVEVKKQFRGKKPNTSYKITRRGQTEFERYCEHIRRLLAE